MTGEENSYCIWVDWDRHRVSLRPTAGYERVCFFSREAYQENLRILERSGFQID